MEKNNVTTKVRFIHMIKDGDLETERLSITGDLEAPAQDFCSPGYVIESDTTHEMDLPEGFPINNDFARIF